MATTYTLTGGLADANVPFVNGKVVAHIALANVKDNAILDTDTDRLVFGRWPIDHDAEGDFSNVLPSTAVGAGYLPNGGFKFCLYVDCRTATGERLKFASQPFELTEDTTLATALGGTIELTAVSAADWADFQAKYDELKGVVATTAGVMAAVDADPGTDFRTQQDARLAATFGTEIETPGTPAATAVDARIAEEASGAGIPLSRFALGAGTLTGATLFDTAALIAEIEATGGYAYIPPGDWEPNVWNIPLDNTNVDEPYVSTGWKTRFTYRFQGAGKHSRIRLPAAMTNADWLFIANSTDVENTHQHPKIICRDFTVGGYTVGHDTNFLLANWRSVWAENVMFEVITQGFKTTGYADFCSYDHVTGIAMTTVAGKWMIENTDNGDGFLVNSVFSIGTPTVRLRGVLGGTISNCVAAIIELENSRITLRDNHLEGDGYTGAQPIVKIIRSQVRFSGGYYQTKPFRNTVEIDDSSASTFLGSSVIFDDDVAFACRIDDPGSSYGNLRGTDLRITSLREDGRVINRGARGLMFAASTALGSGGSGTGRVGKFGLAVTSAVAAITSALGERPALLGGPWMLRYGTSNTWKVTPPAPGENSLETVRVSRPVLTVRASTYDGINAYFTADSAAGTYYYALNVIDAANRATDISVEGSATIADGEIVPMTAQLYSPPLRLVVMRGTVSGTYTHYAIVDVAGAYQLLVDQGSAISGIAWTAGTPPTYTTAGGVGATRRGTIHLRDGSTVIYDHAAPTVGTWLQGDIALSRVPAAGTPQGWVCVTAGTPGTWKAMANLAA